MNEQTLINNNQRGELFDNDQVQQDQEPQQVCTAAQQLVAQQRRKEKARIAARARRSQEADIIMDMAYELRITQEKMRRIDKATIVKLAIDYIKAYDILCRFRNLHDDIKTCNGGPVSPIKGPANSNKIIDGPENIDTVEYNKKLLPAINKIDPVCIVDTNSNDYNSDRENENNKYHCRSAPSAAAVAKMAPSALQAPRNVPLPKVSGPLTTRVASQPRYPPPSRPIPLVASSAKLVANTNKKTRNNVPLCPAPKISTTSIFAPKTEDMNSHFLIVKDEIVDSESAEVKPVLVLKPDTEILDDDDLTHLAPSAGESIIMDVEPLDGIVVDNSLFTSMGSPPTKKFAPPDIMDDTYISYKQKSHYQQQLAG